MYNADDLSSVSVAELIATQNWQAQYRLITQWGKLIQPKPALRSAAYLIKGCEVSAWLSHTHENNIHYFAFDSDSRVINGLAVLLLTQVNGKTLEDITSVDFNKLLLDVGLEKHLTPSRNNGLHALVIKIQEFILVG